MKNLNYKVDDETWSQVVPYVKSAPGAWTMCKGLWRKTSTGWVSVETVDATAGKAPTLTASINASTGFLDITLKNGDSRVMAGTILVSTTAYPTSPAQTSGLVFKGSQPLAAAPGVYRASIRVTAGLTYYISGWAAPLNSLTSPRATALVKASKTTPTGPKLYTNTFTILTTDSRTYLRPGAGKWRTDKYARNLYQSGPEGNNGYWFYGTAMSQALKYCTEIISAQITMQRTTGTFYGATTGYAHLGYHNYPTKPAGRPLLHDWQSSVGGMTRGQVKNFNIPKAWWPKMISGEIKGFGLYFDPSTEHSGNYLGVYGKGTVSGQVKITAKFTQAPRITMSGGSQIITYEPKLT